MAEREVWVVEHRPRRKGARWSPLRWWTDDLVQATTKRKAEALMDKHHPKQPEQRVIRYVPEPRPKKKVRRG